MTKMKIGVLGVSGHFLKRIVLPLLQSETVEIHGLASRNRNRAKETALKYGFPMHYGSYDELINDKDINTVFIPLPNHLHKEWIFKCLDAEKHVLCEKPLTMNADETREVIEYESRTDYRVMEAFMYRFHPKWHKAKALIDNGYIGQITHIHTVFSYNNQDPNNIRNIRETGGGALMDIGCYAINTSRYILDKSPKRVVSLISEHKHFKTDVTTSAILDFGEERTLFTTATTSFPQQEVKIFGTEGTLTVTIPFNDISEFPGKLLFENNEVKQTIEVPPTNQYRLMFESFAHSIITNQPFEITLTDSLENMKVIDAIFKSGACNEWVSLD